MGVLITAISLTSSQGGLEFVSKAATIDDPFFIARPADHPSELSGIQVMSVDILPTEIPADSSSHFSDRFLPYLRSLVRSEMGKQLSTHDIANLDVLRRGTIVEGGKLEPPHAWLGPQLALLNSPSSVPGQSHATGTARHTKKKRIAVLGSGMVAKPAVDHLASRKDVEIIIGNCSHGAHFACY